MKKYVTSMSRSQFDQYGMEMLISFNEHWPEGVLEVYSEHQLPVHPDLMARTLPDSQEIIGRFMLRRLQDVPGWQEFMRVCDMLPIFKGEIKGQRNYRYDARAFANKAFAQCMAADNYEGLLYWIDADTKTKKAIPEDWLDQCIEGHAISVMKRKEWHLCSSFIAWDCSHPLSKDFFEKYYSLYAAGILFAMDEWHDAFLVEQILKKMEEPLVHDLAAHINGKGPHNVFDEVFNGMAVHMKGNLKNMMYRYDQLHELVRQRQPKRIVEIGTWNGERALAFHQLAPDAEYIGFDLFEEASADTDKIEKNVKKHYTLDEVTQKLRDAKMQFALIKGDTRKTCEHYIKTYQKNSADFIYIDGGHSVETIKSDLDFARIAIKAGCPIVLDDYYTEMSEAELAKYGCQAVLKDIEHSVLPIKDSVHGGGKVQMAIVIGENTE